MTLATLTPLALENADVLRRLTDPDARALTFIAFAAAVGRDPSNLRKTLNRLADQGMAARDETAACGWSPDPVALDALARLDGTADTVLTAPADAAAPARWPHAALAPDPLQPRKDFDPDKLADLARAIAGAGDVMTPLWVLPPDASGARTIKAGERRWRAVGLLMAGQVPDCVLPPALDPATGGGLPIREVAASPADTAWLALIENGAREALNPIEDGEALLALSTDRGWSARQTAHQLGRVGKTTGQPGAGADGVKQVQERIKVAREATPENKARFLTDPDFTWKDLLATVQVAKPSFHPLEPEVTYDIEAMDWSLKGLSANIQLARDPDGGWRHGYHYQVHSGGGGASPGYTDGGAPGAATRADAFALASVTLRQGAHGLTSPGDLPRGVRLIQWLDALGDGTADPADVPARKPTTWDAEAARIARGEGGASGPAKAKGLSATYDGLVKEAQDREREALRSVEPISEAADTDAGADTLAAEAEAFEEDAIPPYLQRLAGVNDHCAVIADLLAAEPPKDEAPTDAPEDDRTLDDILGPLALMNIVEAADPATGPAFLSGLFARVGFQPPFTASAKAEEEGVVFDGAGRCVLVCDAHGDEPGPMAHAQAIVTAAALNAALGLSVDVAPAVDAEQGAAA